jgi:signal transduction histidine kinase/ActR/RegA family two-component response regulator
LVPADPQLRQLLAGLTAVRGGDFSTCLPPAADPVMDEIATVFNAMTGQLALQDWQQTNLARIAGLIQGHRDLATVAELIMTELIPVVGAQHGAFFLAETIDGETRLRLIAGYGLGAGAGSHSQFRLGESLVGQAAKTKRPIVVTDVPASYARISSGLGDAAPASLIVAPIVSEDQVLGVIEAGSFSPFTGAHREFLARLVETIGVSVAAIIASSRTDALLGESQRLAAELQARQEELQARQEELQRSNAELAGQAAQLARQNCDIENKNDEIERARQEIEERARQLDLASKYKSQFLANMSHELRTPLNSLLILARLLAQNAEGNLTPKQVEYAQVIHSSGTDLLQLINDILDLSRVEAGKLEIHPERFALKTLADDLRAVFGPLTTDKGLDFAIEVGPGAPAELFTDNQRLRQVLHNLLSNAVKFTERGGVELRIGWGSGLAPAEPGEQGLAFSVSDTGIGISAENLETIFGAFQQGDGTTSRRYGGTGLGLAICRELAAQLGGQITARSAPGRGSTFTLCLPLTGPDSGEAAALAPGPGGLAETITRPGTAAGTHGSLYGKKVLIVDDDLRNAFAITSILELYGLTVIHAANGRKGIETLQAAEDIDIVLMDVMMPELDGYATAAAIRGIPGFADLPVIAVTARAMRGDRDKSITAGASDYVTKPVDTEELLTCMERWLGTAARPVG